MKILKISRLEHLFNDHKKLPFPESMSINEELRDIRGELALYDGHMAGLVSSYLQNSPINPHLIKKDQALENRMKNFHSTNTVEEKNIKDLIKYKHKVDDLISLLNQLINDPE